MKVLDLRYKFARVFLAALIASLVLFALNLISFYVFHYSNRRFINWVAILVYGRQNRTFIEDAFCSMIQIGFATAALLGVTYAFKGLTKDHRTLKGMFVGIGIWFVITAMSHIIGIEKALPMDINSAFSATVCSALWGVLHVWILHRLEHRYNVMDL